MKPIIPEYLVCPVCKGTLRALEGVRQELACPACGLAFEVRDGIPSMIRADARQLTDEERTKMKHPTPKEEAR